MAAFDPATLDRWRALAIVDRDGTTVGTISEFYLDRETGYPTWALVNTGLFGASQTFVPLIHAAEISDGLQVPYEKTHIKDTPKVDPHDELTPEEEAELFAHYGVEYQPSAEAAPEEGWAQPGPAASVDPGEGSGDPGPVGAVGPGPVGALDSGSAEPPGPVRADAGSAGSPTVVESGSSLAGASVLTDMQPGPDERPTVADRGRVTHEAPGAVPAEPGPVDPAETTDAEAEPARHGTTGTVPAGPGPEEATTDQYGSGSQPVPEEPGTTEPAEATRVDARRPGADAGGSAGFDSSVGQREEQIDPDPSLTTPVHIDRNHSPSNPPDPTLDHSEATHPDPAPERSGTADHDPDLARTAPVEPGLPGSTAASPYGPAPTTIDKAAHPSQSQAPADEPLRAPDEAGWTPAAAGSFEEHEPLDRPAGASDRWREAKLAAERDRIARAAASQPEERSPLERARRRLERLVGGGQDHPDPDDVSPADREAAERARRARLGLDEDDHHRR